MLLTQLGDNVVEQEGLPCACVACEEDGLAGFDQLYHRLLLGRELRAGGLAAAGVRLQVRRAGGRAGGISGQMKIEKSNHPVIQEP